MSEPKTIPGALHSWSTTTYGWDEEEASDTYIVFNDGRVLNLVVVEYVWAAVGGWVECNKEDVSDEDMAEVCLPEIARLAKENAELREALTPFAEIGSDLTYDFCHRGLCSTEECARCRRILAARAALSRSKT